MNSEKTSFDRQQEGYWDEKEHLNRKDPRNPVIEAYALPKVDYILKHIDLPKEATVLDVGAGNGYFSYYWNLRWDTTATDYSAVMLENNPVPKKEVMDARNMTYPDNSFELSFCHAVFHHIDRQDRVKVLKEMARVSKKYIAFIEPNRNNPLVSAFSILKKEEHGGLAFSNKYVRNLVEDAGLKLIHTCTWGALTPNRMPFSKVLLPLFKRLERPLPFGMTNIVIAEKAN